MTSLVIYIWNSSLIHNTWPKLKFLEAIVTAKCSTYLWINIQRKDLVHKGQNLLHWEFDCSTERLPLKQEDKHQKQQKNHWSNLWGFFWISTFLHCTWILVSDVLHFSSISYTNINSIWSKANMNVIPEMWNVITDSKKKFHTKDSRTGFT